MKPVHASLSTLVLLVLPIIAGAEDSASTGQAHRIADLEQRVADLEAALRLRETARRDRPTDSGSGGLHVGGDFRLRFEHTASPAGTHRNRGVLRGRLAADYELANGFSVGARLTTGDPDDPNTADVTLGNFVDDLDVSLDRAYLAWQHDRLDLMAGKIPSPATLTDLVWDGDVNLNGVSASFAFDATDRIDIRLAGIYAIVDEQIQLEDSRMAGARLSISWSPADRWQSTVGIGYFDYSIGSLDNANAGDVRDNLLSADNSSYLSDFDLLNFHGNLVFESPLDGWPVTLTGDYVRNLGAAVPEDSGYAVGGGLGQARRTGDLKFAYQYMTADTDAVFAALSHDNIPWGSNYRMHALNARYVPFERAFLDLVLYRFARLEAGTPGEGGDGTRLRVNVGLSF